MYSIPNKYSRTVMYQITCKDKAKHLVYVGQTVNFLNRKGEHRRDSKRSFIKVYAMIRENGGWDNFEMTKIERYPCKSLREATLRERYWCEQLNANMNYVLPTRSKEEYRLYYENQVQQLLTANTDIVHKFLIETCTTTESQQDSINIKELYHIFQQSDYYQNIDTRYRCNFNYTYFCNKISTNESF